MPATIVTGLQWGDEGKGKMVDHLAENAAAVARFSGGANAGHTVVVNGRRIALHQLPSGLLRPGVLGIIGASCVLDPVSLTEEMLSLEEEGFPVDDRLTISGNVHLVHPAARYFEKTDESSLGEDSVGTTGRGIGPTYVRKFSRRGLRLEDAAIPGSFTRRSNDMAEECVRQLGLGREEEDALREETGVFNGHALDLVTRASDVSMVISRILRSDGIVIAEGAQGTLLDPDHGTYPYVTCGSCVAGAACVSLGIGPVMIDEVVGVMKAYNTRVGNGPFPTELTDELGDRIREKGNEYGATTGRPRRCGWFDGVLASYAARLNGSTWTVLTLLDVLSGFPELMVCKKYQLDPEIDLTLFETGARLGRHVPVFETLPGWQEDITGETSWEALPKNAREYVLFIEKLTGVPVRAVSTGPAREDLIWRT
ncbi:MAG: adenylosuccinate synthase [Candidatus Fermentibacteraceae bacterium]|nr:adenylosuccinate synthase [Candidatus Fermentibacteraceae bacterium]MBN2609025.1 adenylosuccinate synthase [Candidatus Fermentibacteraceae bacterium]